MKKELTVGQMTTNITPIEALEKIKKEAEWLTHGCIGECKKEKCINFNTYSNSCEMEFKTGKRIKEIATQALAPQECDVTKCKYYKKSIIPDNDFCSDVDCLCIDNPNCYYKQLHSQEKTFFKTGERAIGVEDRDYIKGEKTFTVEEIRKVMTDYMRSKRKFGLQLNPTRINELLAEYEKEGKND